MLRWTGTWTDTRAIADGKELRVRFVKTGIRTGYWRTSIDGVDTHPREQGYESRQCAKRALLKKVRPSCA